MSSLLIGAAVTAACSVGCWLMRARQRGRLQTIQAIRSVTIEELQGLQQGVAKEIGAGAYTEAVKLQADIVCEQPLIAPFTEENCIAYQSRVVEVFEERVTTTDSEGKSTTTWQRQDQTISQEERRCPFMLQQGSHSIDVDPEGAEIGLVEILNRMEPGPLASRGNPLGIEGAASLATQLGSAFRSINSNTSQDQSFRLIGYRREESIFPASGSVFIVAEVSDFGGSLVLGQPQEKGLFLIRNEGEERLLNRLKSSIQLWTIGGVGFTTISIVVVVWKLLGN